jgi:phosphoribosylformimino-5-aminoimidazole carboxamide ribotide isomerase
MQNFQIIPALDIKNGQVERSLKGDPFYWVEKFEKAGAEFLHLVDFNQALGEEHDNFDLIRKIISQTKLKVELSAGIDNLAKLKKYLALKPWQLILPSQSLVDFKFLNQVIKDFGSDQITLAVDVNQGFVDPRGFKIKEKIRLTDLISDLKKLPIKRYIFTEKEKDGSLKGCNLKATQEFKKLIGPDKQFIASGGVASIEEIKALKKAKIDGCIIGRALYDNKVNLKQVLNEIN